MPKLPPVKRFDSNTGARIYRIACEMLPELSGRVYLVLGTDTPTLVDTGTGRTPAMRSILAGFETVRDEFGEAFQLEDLGRILVTHAHVDHVGGLAELAGRTGARVGAHPLDCRILEAYNERAVLVRHAFGRFLRHAGLSKQRRETLLDAFGYRKDRLTDTHVDDRLADGQTIGGLEVLHTPGHSPGHVCYRAGNLLLAGDHILARTVPQQWPESTASWTGLGHYLQSLERVARLEGIDVTLGGHEPPIRRLGDRITEIRRTHDRRLERILDILATDGPMTIFELTQRMYSRQTGVYELLALTDVGARVEYLDQHGRLAIINPEKTHEAAYRYAVEGS